MRLLRRFASLRYRFLVYPGAWVSFLPSRSRSEYTAAAIAALARAQRKYVFLKPLALEPVPSAYLGARRPKAAPFDIPTRAQLCPPVSGRSWLVGVSDAPRKLRGRLHRLADAAQALAKRLFGLLKVVFALYLGCCQKHKASLGAATKIPRKAVPTRPALRTSAPGKVTAIAIPFRT